MERYNLLFLASVVLFVSPLFLTIITFYAEIVRPFNPNNEQTRERIFSIGTDIDISSSVKLHDVFVIFNVTQGGSAQGFIRLDIQNQDAMLLPTFIVILPPDVIVHSASIHPDKTVSIDKKDCATIKYLPAGEMMPNSGRVLIVDFVWPSFAQATSGDVFGKPLRWGFHAQARNYHYEYGAIGNGFYPLKQLDAPTNQLTIRPALGVNDAQFRLVDYYPTTGKSIYPNSATGQLEQSIFDFNILGSYADLEVEANMRIIQNISIALFSSSIGTFGAGIWKYIHHRRAKWNDRNSSVDYIG